MRGIHWPDNGNGRAFRRSLLGTFVPGTVAAAAALIAAVWAGWVVPGVAIAIGVSAVLAEYVLARRHARRVARRVEIVLSFSGLEVLHQGTRLKIREKGALIGEWRTRRQAADAAIAVGCWAVLVRAYGRYWALAADTVSTSGAVSFRNRAVADIVPAIA